MRALLILGPLVLLGLFLAGRWFVRTPTPFVSRFLRRGAVVLALLALLFLAASGRLHWLIAIVGALFAALVRLFPLVRYVPVLHRLWRAMGYGASSTDQAGVQTRFVRMSLDQATGRMDGEILEGAFAGRRLHELSRAQLITLFKEWRQTDRDSASLLAAYLDRLHGPDWRDGAGAGSPGSFDRGHMTREEAYRVLGLQPGARDSDVTAAHRRLMQKIHPDRGGSDYLAAKINQAKDILLEH